MPRTSLPIEQLLTMWGGNIARMLAEDTPTWKAINPRTWIASTDCGTQQFQRWLRAFTEQRRELLADSRREPPASDSGMILASKQVFGNPM